MNHLDQFLQINSEVVHFLLRVSYTFQIHFTFDFFPSMRYLSLLTFTLPRCAVQAT